MNAGASRSPVAPATALLDDALGALDAFDVLRARVAVQLARDLLQAAPGDATGAATVDAAAPDAPSTVLTPRERTLLVLVAEGCTNRVIAQRLHLSEKTVRNQFTALFAKLGIHRRVEAAVYAIHHGLDRDLNPR